MVPLTGAHYQGVPVPYDFAVHEIGLPDLLQTDFGDATRRWRGEAAALLATPIDAAAELQLVNLLSPAGFTFWSACPPWSLATRRLPSDAAIQRDLKAILKSLPKSPKGAGPGSPPFLEWLQPLFEGLGDARARIVRTLCVQAPWFRELGRRQTCVVATSDLPGFVAEQNALMHELASHAFLGADERFVMRDGLEPASLRAAFFSGLSPITFAQQPQAWEFMHQRLLAAISGEIRHLEAGDGFAFQLEPLRVVNPVVNFHLPISGALSRQCEPLLQQVLSCRARLVRLLGWPNHLASALSALGTHESALPTIDSYGAVAPFHAGDELRAYVADMRARYPRFTSIIEALA